MQASLTISKTFSCAHRLARPDLDDDTNRNVYGKCARPNGHGHDYHLEITVMGEVDDRTGMVVELGALHDLLDREIVDRFDHHFLNHDIPYFANTVPTAENIAIYIRNLLQTTLPQLGIALQRVKLHESPNNACEVFAVVAPTSAPTIAQQELAIMR